MMHLCTAVMLQEKSLYIWKGYRWLSSNAQEYFVSYSTFLEDSLVLYSVKHRQVFWRYSMT